MRQVVFFSGSKEKPESAFAFPDGDVFALRFSRDSAWLLAAGGVGAESGKVVVFDASTGKRLFEVGNESDVVLTFDVSPDRSLIALGGPGRVVKIYRTNDGELVATLGKHTDWILSIAFSPDGLLLASSDRFGGVQVWEALTGRPFLSLRGHTGAVNSVAWSNDSERLLSGGQDGFLRVWDMHHGLPLRHWNAEVGGVLSTEWSATGLIVAGGRSKQIAVFDSSGQRLRGWSLPDEVVELDMLPDGGRVVAGDAAGNLSAWDIKSGKSVGTYVLPIASAIGRVETSAPARKPRSQGSILHVSTDDERELAQTREALSTTESAVKATEDSLAKLKSFAESLRRLISARESAVNRNAVRPAAESREFPPTSDGQR